MTKRWLVKFLWVLAVTAPVALEGQSSRRLVHGVVVSQQTGRPIDGVLVTAVPWSITARTDTTGAFRLLGVGNGEFDIEFRRLGFAAVALSVEVDDDMEVGDLGTVRLEPLATLLEDVVVEAERADRRLSLVGFYDRQKLGFGSFVDREAIEEMNPNRMTEVVSRMKGFTVVPNPNYMKSLPVPRSAFGYATGPSPGADTRRYVIQPRRGRLSCEALIFVDGVQIGTTLDTDIDGYVHPSAVQAVEAYAGPSQLPTEFNRLGGECGAFLIWTR